MTRGRLIGLLIAAAVVLALAIYGALQLRPASHSVLLANRPRQLLVVLAQVGGSCKLVTVYGERAYRKEMLSWRIFDACGFTNRKVRLRFTRSNDPNIPYPGDSPTIEDTVKGNHEALVRLTVRDFTGNPPPCGGPNDGNQTCWAFDYVVEIQDASNPNLYIPIADPRLEVDP